MNSRKSCYFVDQHSRKSAWQRKNELAQLILLSFTPSDYYKMAVVSKFWQKMATDNFPLYIGAAFADSRRYELMTICVINKRSASLKLIIDMQEYPTNMRLNHLLVWLAFIYKAPVPTSIRVAGKNWERYIKELEIFRNTGSFVPPLACPIEMDIELIEHYHLANNTGSEVFMRMLVNMVYPNTIFWIQRVYKLLAPKLHQNRSKYREVYSNLITAADLIVVPGAMVVPSYCDISDDDWKEYLYFRNPNDDSWNKWIRGVDTRYLKPSFVDKIPDQLSYEGARVLAQSYQINVTTYYEYADKRKLKSS